MLTNLMREPRSTHARLFPGRVSSSWFNLPRAGPLSHAGGRGRPRRSAPAHEIGNVGDSHRDRLRVATKLYLTFERFRDTCGVYAGTFDDPNWFEILPETSKHIFIEMARHETILPPRVNAFAEHAITNEGDPNQPVVFDQPHVVGRRN